MYLKFSLHRHPQNCTTHQEDPNTMKIIWFVAQENNEHLNETISLGGINCMTLLNTNIYKALYFYLVKHVCV